MPDDPVLDNAARLRLAQEALARAKADALAKGNRPAHTDDQRSQRYPPAGSPRPPGPARRARRDDPERLSAANKGLIDARGWAEAASTDTGLGRSASSVRTEPGPF